MSNFIGVKIVDAIPMNSTEAMNRNYKVSRDAGMYNKIDGYEVTYEDGYKSWSPKDVFDKAYKIIDLMIPVTSNLLPHQERVLIETKELGEKVNKLYDFINNNKIFITLSLDEQTRLSQQLIAMQYYLTILIERINEF
jgi:hypothetical protein